MAALRLRSGRRPARIGVTPLIDVVFILMVFFMLASTFTEDRQIALDARRTAEAPTATPTLLLAVRPDGLAIAGRAVSPEAALKLLRERAAAEPALAVAVRPSAGVTLQAAVDAVDLAREAGVASVALAR